MMRERERCIETYRRYAVPCCGHCHACSIVMSRVPMYLKCGSHQRWEALVRGGGDASLEAPTRRSGVGEGRCGLRRSMPRPAATLGCVRVQHCWGAVARGGNELGVVD